MYFRDMSKAGVRILTTLVICGRVHAQEANCQVVGGTGVQDQEGVALDAFGTSVARDGTRLIVGAPGKSSGVSTNAGVTFVFDGASQAINELTQVVGWNEERLHALLWEGESPYGAGDWQVRDLDATVNACPGSWAILQAHDINANGWIVCLADADPGGLFDYYAVLLTPASADIDFDGEVGIDEFLAVLGNWGPCPTNYPDDLGKICTADANGDCLVGIYDFLAVIGNWTLPYTIDDAVEDAGLEQAVWNEQVGILTDDDTPEDERANIVCWMEHYMDCHRSPLCIECMPCVLCPDDDPFGGH